MSAEVWEQAKREANRPVTIGEQFEAIIDRSSLEEVVGVLREICYRKAEHVEEVWQDSALARAWSGAANEFDKLAVRFDKSQVPMISRRIR